jgi:hypothetical protein
MTFKRRALSALSKAELLDLGCELELDVTSRMSVEALRDAIAISKRARLEKVITTALSRDTLKAVCEHAGSNPKGRRRFRWSGGFSKAAGGRSGSIKCRGGLVDHTFQLRRVLWLRFSLPSDLTAGGSATPRGLRESAGHRRARPETLDARDRAKRHDPHRFEAL